MSNVFLDSPPPPYYAVIFTSVRTENDQDYDQTDARMFELARQQEGFLGLESVQSSGRGITVSYWRSEAAIQNWKQHTEHVQAQQRGKRDWYRDYAVRVCRVERDAFAHK